ncbi:hypothetical protein ACFLZC_02125 [Patescibacteria group bacterium]
MRYEKNGFNEILESSRELKDSRDTLLAKFNSISNEQLAKFYKVLPEEPEENDLMLQFSSIAQKSGVVVKRLNLYEETEAAQSLYSQQVGVKKSYKVLKIEAVFLASYEGFGVFLKELEKNLRLIDVESISFSSNKEGLYEFTIKANSYFKS